MKPKSRQVPLLCDKVSIPKRGSEAVKPPVTPAKPPKEKVSIPKRGSEAVKQNTNFADNGYFTIVSIPKRGSEAVKHQLPDGCFFMPKVSIPKRGSEAVKPLIREGIFVKVSVSIPKRGSEAVKLLQPRLRRLISLFQSLKGVQRL